MPKTYSDLFSEVRQSVRLISLDDVKKRLESDKPPTLVDDRWPPFRKPHTAIVEMTPSAMRQAAQAAATASTLGRTAPRIAPLLRRGPISRATDAAPDKAVPGQQDTGEYRTAVP